MISKQSTPSGLFAQSQHRTENRPLVRWWWFAQKIRKSDINTQLDWLRHNGFGGVEIAWVYPSKKSREIPSFLGPEWCDLVGYTKRACEERNLICDFTFGTLWPFGGSIVKERDASKTFHGTSTQRLENTWENGEGKPPSYLIDHLDKRALENYSSILGEALRPALAGRISALFCDSWEVDPEGLWTEGFGHRFRERYGYSIEPYMGCLDSEPQRRYDYMRLRASYVLEQFYKPYARICHELGALARVQSHGAPTDLLRAYAYADIPESEALLFDPQFSVIAAAAAALSRRPVVTAEAFSCLYGWRAYPGPGQHQTEEQLPDLKYVADALFANGVNQIIWHGMPFNGEGENSRFYATVHVGPDAAFADRLPDFNNYLRTISSAMKHGKTRSRLAVYIPNEDMMMRGKLPERLQRPSALYHWEMQYLRFSKKLRGYRPIWISESFLIETDVEAGVLHCGDIEVDALYVDVKWLEYASLCELRRIVDEGGVVFLSRIPKQPGTLHIGDYDETLDRLLKHGRVERAFPTEENLTPLVSGTSVPEFWCRGDTETWYFFFAHPCASTITYPMKYGESHTSETIVRDVTLHLPGDLEAPYRLIFRPYESILLECSNGRVKRIDLDFHPGEAVPEE